MGDLDADSVGEQLLEQLDRPCSLAVPVRVVALELGQRRLRLAPGDGRPLRSWDANRDAGNTLETAHTRAQAAGDRTLRAYLRAALAHDRAAELHLLVAEKGGPEELAHRTKQTSTTGRHWQIASEPEIFRLGPTYRPGDVFADQPERWRTVLWGTEIETESPGQVAKQLDMTPNGVTALAYPSCPPASDG